MPLSKSEKRPQKSTIKKRRKRKKSVRQLLAELYPVPNFDRPGAQGVFRSPLDDSSSKSDSTAKRLKQKNRKTSRANKLILQVEKLVEDVYSAENSRRSSTKDESLGEEKQKKVITEDDKFSLTCYRDQRASTKETSAQTNTSKKRRGCLSWVSDLQTCALADLINYASSFQTKEFDKIRDQNSNDCLLKFIPGSTNPKYNIAWGITSTKSEQSLTNTATDVKPLIQAVRSVGTSVHMSERPLLLEAGAQTPSSFTKPASCDRQDCPARTFATQTNPTRHKNGINSRGCSKPSCPFRSTATQTYPSNLQSKSQNQSVSSRLMRNQSNQGHQPSGWNSNSTTRPQQNEIQKQQSWPGQSGGQSGWGANNSGQQNMPPQHSWTESEQPSFQNQIMPQQASWNNAWQSGLCSCCSCYGQPHQRNSFCNSHNIQGGNLKCEPQNLGDTNQFHSYNEPYGDNFGRPQYMSGPMRPKNINYQNDQPYGARRKSPPQEKENFTDTGTRGVQTQSSMLSDQSRGDRGKQSNFDNSRGLHDEYVNPSMRNAMRTTQSLTPSNQWTTDNSTTQVSETTRENSGSSDSYSERQRDITRVFESLGVSESARNSILSAYAEIDRDDVIQKTLAGLPVSEQNSILEVLAAIEKEAVRDTILETVSESVRNSILSTLSNDDRANIRESVLEGASESVRNSILSTLSDIDKENIRESILEGVSESARNSIISSLSELEREETIEKALEGLSESARNSILSALSELDREEMLAMVMEGLSESVRNSIEKIFDEIDKDEILAKALEGLDENTRNAILAKLAEASEDDGDKIGQKEQVRTIQQPPGWVDCAGGNTDCCLSDDFHDDNEMVNLLNVENEEEEGMIDDNYDTQGESEPNTFDNRTSEDERHQEQLEEISPTPVDPNPIPSIRVDDYDIANNPPSYQEGNGGGSNLSNQKPVSLTYDEQPSNKGFAVQTVSNKMTDTQGLTMNPASYSSAKSTNESHKKRNTPPDSKHRGPPRKSPRSETALRGPNFERETPYSKTDDPECRKKYRKGSFTPPKKRGRGYEACVQKRCNEKDAECRRGGKEKKRCTVRNGGSSARDVIGRTTVGTQIDMM